MTLLTALWAVQKLSRSCLALPRAFVPHMRRVQAWCLPATRTGMTTYPHRRGAYYPCRIAFKALGAGSSTVKWTRKVLNKGSFGSLALPTLIRGLGQIEQIELVGLCTDICVISNALILKAAFPETLVSVVSTACAGVTPAAHQNALDAMRSCQVNVL